MEEQAQVTAMADLKRGAKESGFVKHQRKWELAETRRHSFDFKPKVHFKDRFTTHANRQIELRKVS